MWPTLQSLFLYDKINRRNLLKEFTILVKTPQTELGLIAEYQMNNLKSILEYAVRNVPFYRKVFKECKSDNKNIFDPSI